MTKPNGNRTGRPVGSMSDMEGPSVHITIAVNGRLHRRVKELAEAQDSTVGNWIRRAIKQRLDRGHTSED